MRLLPFAGSCDPKLLSLAENTEHLLFQAVTGINQADCQKGFSDLFTMSSQWAWMSQCTQDIPGKEPGKESSLWKHPGMFAITESSSYLSFSLGHLKVSTRTTWGSQRWTWDAFLLSSPIDDNNSFLPLETAGFISPLSRGELLIGRRPRPAAASSLLFISNFGWCVSNFGWNL